ncbi:MAG: lytic transglycosylase domain-containing protein [Deltaproteobacteria bacterium]|nr:lytic transglycosylase domain-containing protein [Deltaproteobacteria bacterium]
MLSREQKLIQIAVAICITLGFLVFIAIYLPQKLDTKAPSPAKPQPDPAASVDHQQTTMEDNPLLAAIVEHPIEESTVQQTMFKPSKVKDPAEQPAGPLREIGKSLQSLAWLNPDKSLRPAVDFWKSVYSEYDGNHVVMHDSLHLDIVYTVLDLSPILKDATLSDRARIIAKEEAVDGVRDRIKHTLFRLAQGEKALTPDEQRIRELFLRVPTRKNEFLAAMDRVRGQTGQKDKFIAGIERSQLSLGSIERIFEQQGLPKELTRLIFVESMFNPKAHSAVGAYGIWQIMKGTAKNYGLRVDKHVDERGDLIASSIAAAKLLKHNYQELGSWPLAINAYNAGRGRLKHAVAQLGTKDIATIMRNYQHPAYGFASRNFFAEFLAAYEVAAEAPKLFSMALPKK